VLALKSGIFSLYAHPDIFLQNYRKWDDKAKWLTKQIIELSIKYKVPLGFNANGLHQIRNDFNYPSRLFWKEVAKSKAKVLIEADAHHIPTLSKSWLEKAKREAIKYGLKKNLVDKIDIKYLH
jgi:histidinol phosphatase-like PHP family hydrolase